MPREHKCIKCGDTEFVKKHQILSNSYTWLCEFCDNQLNQRLPKDITKEQYFKILLNFLAEVDYG